MAHTCHARNCTAAVPPEMLMCKRHWFMVPKAVRDEVWATYLPGQCDDMDPSEEWHQAADAAIKAVFEKEQPNMTTPRTMPAQKPGKSKQDYETPWELIHLIEAAMGSAFEVDLAARADNAKAPTFITPEEDSLIQPWCQYGRVMMWLNPPFGNIAPWAKKCAEEGRATDGVIYFLVPASIGSAWWRDWVYPHATTYALHPRISFDGEGPFPKDCILCEYGPDARPGVIEPLGWK